MKEKLKMEESNSDPLLNILYSCMSCCTSTIEIEDKSFGICIRKTKEGIITRVLGPGCHLIGPFSKLHGTFNFHEEYENNLIESPVGDFKILRVN